MEPEIVFRTVLIGLGALLFLGLLQSLFSWWLKKDLDPWREDDKLTLKELEMDGFVIALFAGSFLLAGILLPDFETATDQYKKILVAYEPVEGNPGEIPAEGCCYIFWERVQTGPESNVSKIIRVPKCGTEVFKEESQCPVGFPSGHCAIIEERLCNEQDFFDRLVGKPPKLKPCESRSNIRRKITLLIHKNKKE